MVVAVAHRGRAGAWLWLARAFAVAAAGVVVYFSWTAWGHEAFMAWMREANPVWFFAAMAVLPAVGVPWTPLYILAGATFGARYGVLGSLLAIAANLTLCYFIARSRLRPWLERILRRFGYRLPDLANRSALRFTLIVRLAPGLPMFVRNYALGSAGVPFWLYFGVSMAITSAYAVAFVVLGESVLEHDLRALGAAVAVLAAAGGAIWWWRKRRARAGASD
jgi:uncharacterized membrane protein YdjX (TVP38/TMEM64 family)